MTLRRKMLGRCEWCMLTSTVQSHRERALSEPLSQEFALGWERQGRFGPIRDIW